MKFLAVVLLVGMLAGCANKTARDAVKLMNRDAEATGSPFRWKHETIQGQTIMQLTLIELPGGPSKADAALQAAILEEISRREVVNERPPAQVAEVKLMPDGREVWVLRSVKYGVAYVVSMGKAADGRVRFFIEGPVAFQRKGDLPRELDLVAVPREGSAEMRS